MFIRNAFPEDRQSILDLMAPYNMHHVPSPEMPALETRFFISPKKTVKLPVRPALNYYPRKLARLRLWQ